MSQAPGSSGWFDDASSQIVRIATVANTVKLGSRRERSIDESIIGGFKSIRKYHGCMEDGVPSNQGSFVDAIQKFAHRTG
jgi:hypothetical protein